MTLHDMDQIKIKDAEGMSIGYLIPEFPGQTHILFWREIVRLRDTDVKVHVASTIRPDQPCAHPFRDEPCSYVWPVSRAALGGMPSIRRVLKQVSFALRLHDGGWRERLKVLAMIPSSWMLAAWARRHGIDHLHVHSFANSAYLAALFRIGTGITYSLVLHGDRAVYGLNHAAKLALADFACAIDLKTRREIEDAAPGVCLDDLMPCGVTLEKFKYAPRNAGSVLRLISVGRLNHCKGLNFCFEAIANLRGKVDIRYTLVGDGPDADEIRSQAEKAGISEIVDFLGSRTEAEVVDLLHCHDIAVLTSHGLGEATATAIREAMATGMPVIMSDIGDARNMVEPGTTGLIVPQRDVQAITNAILWYAENRERIPAMGAAARAKAERDFSDAVAVRILVREVARRRAQRQKRPAPAQDGVSPNRKSRGRDGVVPHAG
jgi:glycosyltransferase involved in cell wall biosynthesis